ncbi:MAG TPA: polymer-forming cytoskeletal protein [Rhizomicrobium sp.]|jgi:cytoskeletal protein CcmA (bactofilin family)|nr:polymer-forming cytoskeletal protein [Rhizomicrobium sp.]
MFSSKSKDADATASAAPQIKRAARSAAPSIISGDLVVQGTLTSTGDIQIDGRVEGDVRSAGLVIGDKAFIQGEILADDVTVRGRVQGGIRARKVLLCATSHVEGNILHEAFAVEAGAFFEGNCRHSDNPLAEDAGRQSQSFQAKPGATPQPVAAAPAVSPAMPVNTIKAPDMTAPRPAPAATFQQLKSNG